ncbi:uncharacterized protein LY89DRAFT_127668 [Mollisia scopiformis]|uniref:C2H2-type domain-containing protein n=1 Tax=Mollisia scopiformis TaxID=149040 RepID=A0A194X4A9_MOLSC|nr:uncharacterized protein LY89DRAFT_127668 [Mollisia scopiformis]KUJ15010.1 hypothetical protein LY89DRAFT_127668 [Mollisia scopiformis]
MATFRPVNTTLVPESHGRNGEETNPLTPRPNTAPTAQVQQMMRDDATTPTRANFGTLASQRPLPPASPFPAAIPATSNAETPNKPHKPLNRGDSQHSAKSRESDDVEMGDSDGEDGSDDDGSENADGSRTNKKKGKSQRFYCSDYPPCNLSFTRSEHLARHIRKHTGERPFQCHCSRRFSRLDNLRQHAQTVHQNEEIPQDSLAATGTRFQRQVRTDRVRPPGSRSRASTAGSQSGPIRGHQRNSLSTSSIGSVSSVYSQRDDMRRRPTPLVMAGERQRFSQEIYGRPDSPSGQYQQFRSHSPGFSTPTSATFSTGQNSPRWGSGMQSPISSHSRTNSTNVYGHRTPGRRLSVPSAGNPFQSPHGNTYGPPVLGQMNASNMGSFSPSGSMISSPTTSTSGWGISSRRESLTSSDEAWRRRTWHPDSQSFTSRLQQVTTPNYYSNGPPPQPTSVLPSNVPPLQSMRLPGIESFDPLPRPTTPVRRQPSPMVIDTPSRAPPPEQYQERPASQQWEQGMNRNMNRLDLSQGTPPTDGASHWANDTNRAMEARAEQTGAQPGVRFEHSVYSNRPQTSGGAYHQHHISAPPAPITPREAKRMGWYHGPVAPNTQPSQPVQRTSPADSSSSEGGIPGTPSSSTAVEYNPGIVHASGWVENRNGNIPTHHDPRAMPTNGYSSYPPPNGAEASYTYAPGHSHAQVQQHQQQIPKSSGDMNRLEALVAVATSSDNVAAAY